MPNPTLTLRAQLALKHLMDVLASTVLLAALSPLFLVIALAIWREDGAPVLFVQRRLGRDGRLFSMLKFRSMRLNSPTLLNPDGSTAVVEGDSRVTKVGAFLRRTSLDELPQLVNVLRGQMSLVGPRPDLPEHFAQYSETERRKLRMKPGITGLPQVMGRNDLPWKERILLDIHYIDNYSLVLDLRILFRTVFAVVSGRGVTAKG